ncbi:MAG: hypothetical protein ACK41O_01535 [Runella zeae]
MKWWIAIMLSMSVAGQVRGGASSRSYRVTLERISLLKSEAQNHEENLFGSIWAGAYCNSNEGQSGNSFDSRERTLKLFERSPTDFVRVKEGGTIVINKSLIFDIPNCNGNQANITLTASLSEQNGNRKYTTERLRVYLSEINGILKRTINCYNRGSHFQLTFVISNV